MTLTVLAFIGAAIILAWTISTTVCALLLCYGAWRTKQ